MREPRVWSFLRRPRYPLGDPPHRFPPYTLSRPARGSLLQGLICGVLTFPWFCCVTLFHEVMTILEVSDGSTIVFTVLIFLATLRARWKGKDILGESQPIR